MTDLEEAKKIIIDHLNEVCTVKNTKWEYVIDPRTNIGEYKEVDAGYTEKEMQIMRQYRYRDMKQYFKLRDLLDDLL